MRTPGSDTLAAARYDMKILRAGIHRRFLLRTRIANVAVRYRYIGSKRSKSLFYRARERVM